MTFVLTWENANKLTRFAKAYCYKKEDRPWHKLIACRISNNCLTAKMLDGYKACSITLPVLEVENNTDADFLIAPSAKLFKKSDMKVTIKNSQSQTEYETMRGATRYVKADCGGVEPMDVKKILNTESKFSV